MSQATAVFGGGCFWCVEAIFSELSGVLEVIPGYSGGHVENPTYEQVCTDTTGHAEVVQVTYDPESISYEDLLRIFFSTHDPTTLNRQGEDVGTQYRSVIFYSSEEQRQSAERIKAEMAPSGMTPLSRRSSLWSVSTPRKTITGIISGATPERLLQHGHCSQGGQVPQRIQPAAKALTGKLHGREVVLGSFCPADQLCAAIGAQHFASAACRYSCSPWNGRGSRIVDDN